MKNKLLQTLKYIGIDIISSSLAWLLFMYYRVVYLDKSVFVLKPEYILNMSIISICWVTFYSILGQYNAIYRKSRLKEISQILMATLVGVTIIFFAVLLDDFIINYKPYYT